MFIFLQVTKLTHSNALNVSHIYLVYLFKDLYKKHIAQLGRGKKCDNRFQLNGMYLMIYYVLGHLSLTQDLGSDLMASFFLSSLPLGLGTIDFISRQKYL